MLKFTGEAFLILDNQQPWKRIKFGNKEKFLLRKRNKQPNGKKKKQRLSQKVDKMTLWGQPRFFFWLGFLSSRNDAMSGFLEMLRIAAEWVGLHNTSSNGPSAGFGGLRRIAAGREASCREDRRGMDRQWIVKTNRMRECTLQQIYLKKNFY